MAESRPPQFSLSLAEARAEGEAQGIDGSWIARIRALLLLGRSPDELRERAGRVLSRAAGLRPFLQTTLLEQRQVGDGAVKLLVGLADGNAVETVVLPTPRGVSVCLSTQVGCPIGCRFCASGRDGLLRNLESHEIVEQLVHARAVRPDLERLVVMGIGEPLLNERGLFPALHRIRDEAGIGPRRMLVSTVGARGSIRRLGRLGLPVSLALSLHAPDDALRARLIPSLKDERVEDLIRDVEWYIGRTRNKALAETTLLAGVNDSDELARRTGRLLRGRQIYLNVIPYNPIEGLEFEPVSVERARRFVEIVRQNGAFATVRKTMGREAAAACGQLRAHRADHADAVAES